MRHGTAGILFGLTLVFPLLSQHAVADALAHTLAETLSSNELELIERAPLDTMGIVRSVDPADLALTSPFVLCFDQETASDMTGAGTAPFPLSVRTPDPSGFGWRSFPSPLSRSSRVRC